MGVNYMLKSLRAKNDITQRYMAQVLNVTVATYNRKENGLRDFTLGEAKIIADYFNVTIDEIFLQSQSPKWC